MIAALLVRWGLSQRVAGVLAYVLPALAFVALCGALWLWIDSREAADDRANQQIGRTVEREQSQAVTIERVEQANEAREEIEQPGAAGDRVRYEQCLRSARTPGSCVRFLPE